MRFNKKSLLHWLVLALSTFNTLVAALLRRSKVIKPKKIVVFYGHTLNGNLKAFYDYLEKEGEYTPAFATMFPSYLADLKKEGVNALATYSLRDSLQLGRASAIITSHGAHFLFPAYKHTNMAFMDVFHGIVYKGFGRDNFGEVRQYDEVWVSSPTFVDIYKEKYFFTNKVVATGYGRTDSLINGEYTKEMLIKKYKLPSKYKRMILVAPTWKQDSKNRSIIPFGVSAETFFSKLNQIGRASNALVIFRAHLNSGDKVNSKKYQNLKIMPYANYPLAEEFLGAADLLISDWSSIVFDFLVLKRPVIYLDVPAPFEKGFSLGPELRFGPIVKDMDQLEKQAIKYVSNIELYRKDHKTIIDKSIKAAFGKFADSHSCQRYLERLRAVVAAKQGINA